jgi:serine/threonine-protein kinase
MSFLQRRKPGRGTAAAPAEAVASEFAATVAVPVPSAAMALRLANGQPLGAWEPMEGAPTQAAAAGDPAGGGRPQDAGLPTAPPSDFGASDLDSDLPDPFAPAPGAALPDIVTDLADPPAGRATAPPGMPALDTPTLQHIGRYALKARLGQGGLGQVHEAWDPLLSRRVAVKTLHFDLDVPARVSLDGLFLNEARAVAGLSHPYIVTVYDAGLSAHGVYIAMERLRGRDLRQALAQGWSPTPAQAALLVRRVADALAYAHARGVVHCDIKPANIFLNRRDKPKVLDFGIARVAHRMAQGGGPADRPSSAGLPGLGDAVMGSPHYLAPEQLAGDVVDGRTDVYALGVVFYELLTGRKAFGGDSLEQITSAVLHHHPPPAQDLRPGVPPALAQIAAKAMARAPQDRFAGAADMASALRAWLATQPAVPSTADTLPLPPVDRGPIRRDAVHGTAPGAARGASRRRLPMLLLAAGALALLGGLLGLRGPAAPPEAVRGDSASSGSVQPASAAVARVGGGAADLVLPPAAPAGATPEAPMATARAPAPAPSTLTAPAERAAGARAQPPAAAPDTAGARTARPGPARAATASGAAAPAPAQGELRLAITPWGEVEVNGQPAGTTPPLTRLMLPIGRHQVTVRNADLPPYSVTVEVVADEPVTVRHRF